MTHPCRLLFKRGTVTLFVRFDHYNQQGIRVNRIAGFVFMTFFVGLSAQTFAQIVIARQTIIIGIATVEAGDSLREIDHAARMAAAEINAEGGIWLTDPAQKGLHIVPSISADGFESRLENHPLEAEIIKFSSSAGGVNVAEDRIKLEQFIMQKDPAALIVGALSNEQSLMAATVCAELVVPLLFTAIADSDLEKSLQIGLPARKLVFHTAPTIDYVADFLSGAITHWGAPHDLKRLYLLSERIPWAQEVAGRIIDRALNSPVLEAIGHQHYPVDWVVFKKELKTIDLLLIVGESLGPNLLHALAESPVSLPMIVFVNPRLSSGKPQKSENVVEQGQGRVVFALGSIPSSKYPPSQSFHTNYRKTYGESIHSSQATAPIYDAVHLLKDALVDANSKMANDVIAAMERANRIGVMGRLRFDERHHLKFGLDPTESATSVLVVRSPAGHLRIVYPPGLAE